MDKFVLYKEKMKGWRNFMKKLIVFFLAVMLSAFAMPFTACQNDSEIKAEEPTSNPEEPGMNESNEPSLPILKEETDDGQPAPPPTPESTARNYADKFIADDMAAVYHMGSEAMLSFTDEQTFADLRRYIENAGEFVEHIKTDTERINEAGLDGNRYRITMQHTFAQVTYSMFVESATPDKVSSFAILDVDYTASTVDFPYTVETITIGEGTSWALEGRLTLPLEASADNPVPAVVIVQGSGPSDMNGTYFGERIYFDVADYLAANGIAAIRYDKRTLTHGARMNAKSLTVWEETIEDAILAANLLRADPRIGDVYIFGHSLGGALAPRIHAMGGNFDGLIIAAGTPRGIFDLIIDQFAAQIELEGHIPEVAAAQKPLEEFIELVNALPNMTADEAKNTQVHPLFGGVSAYYFKDFAEHPFEDYIEDISVPIFVAQGRNDYQVPADVDYVMLQKMLDGRDNVTFKLYDGLDHSFMASNATNFIEHRNQILGRAGERVDRQVLADIAAWIKAN